MVHRYCMLLLIFRQTISMSARFFSWLLLEDRRFAHAKTPLRAAVKEAADRTWKPQGEKHLGLSEHVGENHGENHGKPPRSHMVFAKNSLLKWP